MNFNHFAGWTYLANVVFVVILSEIKYCLPISSPAVYIDDRLSTSIHGSPFLILGEEARSTIKFFFKRAIDRDLIGLSISI